MKSKYINTFNTTAEYDAYIESTYPEFPNVALDKEAGEVKIMRTSPNDHLFYGELVDATGQAPNIVFNNNGSYTNYVTIDSLNNTFYLDSWVYVSNLVVLTIQNKENIKSIKKWTLGQYNMSKITGIGSLFYDCSNCTTIDLSSFILTNVTDMGFVFKNCTSIITLDLSSFNNSKVTYMNQMFSGCSSLTTLNICNIDCSNLTSFNSMFYGCTSLTDVYITVEATLMKLTNNLTSQGTDYIPSNNGNCTIHYNDVDYVWSGSAWTPQS